MQYLVLKFLDDFSCLAGDCPSSCCIGWKILVDKEAYERFKQIEPKWLQEEILQGIEEKDGKVTTVDIGLTSMKKLKKIENEILSHINEN